MKYFSLTFFFSISSDVQTKPSTNTSPYFRINLFISPLSLYLFFFFLLQKKFITMATMTTVTTTLPFIKDDHLRPIESDRLILRPLLLSDLEAYRTIRSQPEAMAYSGRGRPDSDLEETQAKLLRLQPPFQNRLVYFGIFLKKPNDNEGDLIGDGGVHKFISEMSGWPEFGYKFKKEYWGQGYATEFVKAFMKFWCNLPRQVAHIKVHPSFLYEGNHVTPKVIERVYAWTMKENKASQRVLEKGGFELFEGGIFQGALNWQFLIFKE
jgi:RimJ/RimL family protein N-acetyltransferase